MSARSFRLLSLTAILAIAGAACSSTETGVPGTGNASIIRLVGVDSCDEYGDWVRQQAMDRVGPYGLDSVGGGVGFDDMVVSERMEADVAAEPMATDAAGEAAPATQDESSTGTNNQEADVDEADLVKTDGSRVVVARGNRLQVFSLVEGAPYLDAALDLGDVDASSVFLIGDRAYVLGGSYGTPVPLESAVGTSGQGDIAPMTTGTTVSEIDLSAEPAVVGQVTLEGMLVDGRMADGAIRLVLRSSPGAEFGFVYPQSTAGEAAATRANREIIAEADPTDWLPRMVGSDGDVTPLVACEDLSHPEQFAGLGTVSIVTIPDGLDSLSSIGVTAEAETVYASSANLYVATNRWGGPGEPEAGSHVDLHAFATEGSQPAVYAASGTVDGRLLNQYSLSESGDSLRVATTTEEPFDCPPNADCAMPPTDNGISVLQQDGDTLVEVGRVDGLGVGEEIRSVRFLGDTAYVVTFRQTDPFYVVDLSDPRHPTVLGELKVPGFSAYLHPVGDGLVLGVGSDADERGRITGAKVSLYDASDPLDPVELSIWTDPSWAFMVAEDPKAFHFDEDSQQVFLPARASYNGGFEDDQSLPEPQGDAVLVFSLADRSVTATGRIDHAEPTPSPQPRPVAADPTTTTTTSTPTTTVPSSTTTVPATTTSVATTTTSTTVPGTAGTVPGDPAIDSEEARVAEGSPVAEPPMAVEPPVLIDEPFAPEEPYYGGSPTVTRAFVVGDRVVSVSDAGVATHTVDTLSATGFASFG